MIHDKENLKCWTKVKKTRSTAGGGSLVCCSVSSWQSTLRMLPVKIVLRSLSYSLSLRCICVVTGYKLEPQDHLCSVFWWVMSFYNDLHLSWSEEYLLIAKYTLIFGYKTKLHSCNTYAEGLDQSLEGLLVVGLISVSPFEPKLLDSLNFLGVSLATLAPKIVSPSLSCHSQRSA